ncbi:patatin-like protein [Kitasatospora sp. NPDC001664]
MADDRSVRHETRLALVLNGGVSLAVWMGGVAHELDLLRHATSGAAEDTVRAEDQPVFRIWKRLAEAARTRVVIDVVAGSSAGGINGMMLATALGRGARLPYLREVWDESASLGKLLEPRSPNSVLSGEAFEAKVTEAVNRIGLGADCTQTPVTLYLPATSVDGRSRSYLDGFGNQFEVHDHRRLYCFRHDARAVDYVRQDGAWKFVTSGRMDFRAENDAALVQAARATGSFPVAFPPVSEYPLLDFRVHPRAALDDPASDVMDAGVLNNAPFSPVLETISHRTFENPVRRVVIYVVPSSGVSGRTDQERPPRDSPWRRTAVSAARYPQEVDFRSSTEDLCNRLANSTRDIQLDLFERVHPNRELAEDLRSIAKRLLGEYRRTRARAVLFEVRRRLANEQAEVSLVVTPEADAERIDRIINRAPGRHREFGAAPEAESGQVPNWVPGSGPEAIDNPFGDEWRWGLAAAERVLQALSTRLHTQLREFDRAQDSVRPGLLKDPEDRARVLDSLATGARQVTDRLREMLAVQQTYLTELRRRSSERELADEETADLIHRVFEELDIPRQLLRLIRQAALDYTTALAGAGEPSPYTAEETVSLCLAIEVVTRAYAPPWKLLDPLMPEFEFLRLGPDKMSRLFNEQQYAALGDRKLYGIRFQHFAAFFNSEWRHNDFAWGRLDAVHHLLHLFQRTEDEEFRQVERELHEAVLRAEAPDGTEPRQWMLDHLAELRESTDNALLHKATSSDGGRKVVAKLGDSVLELMGLTSGWKRRIARRFFSLSFTLFSTRKGMTPARAAQRAFGLMFGSAVVVVGWVFWTLLVTVFFLAKRSW